MKKLNFKKLNLATNDLLHREQLKTVFGGYGGSGGDCTVLCKDDTRVTTDDCQAQTAEDACEDHDGPSSCAGPASSCDA